MPQQHLDHPLVAFAGGEHQRSDALAALQVDIRATLKQRLDEPLVALGGGFHQECEAAGVANLIRRVDPTAAIEPTQHLLLVELTPAFTSSLERVTVARQSCLALLLGAQLA